ncbi:SDR family oxidoreductase [Massilia arenosa]|uniref:SDR family oxidoreductase n=1 Tax=Zemynaea arenosa TaxID=2561931 RepID=A0A4Y9S9I6_9BURK|nr:SDR family oxidoreductase [Massilia arenosa]TFW16748.1 SDR family oxidoreductase [Massilia arenosa]
MTVLVTGANGFVGRAVCAELARRGTALRGAVRRNPQPGQVAVGDLGRDTNWTQALDGCTAVIHLAARVHVMSDSAPDPLAVYRQVNVEATEGLARAAAAAGIRRFVFASSVKVNGEGTRGAPFRADDAPAPVDGYGVSKLDAERCLARIASETGLEVVSVRPCLVYGPGVKANFLNLIRLVQQGWPLPFGSVRNARSMVALDNLVDLLITCLDHPNAPGQTFLVSDNEDLSIGDLVRHIAAALGQTPRLVPVPVGLMLVGAAMLGKRAVAERLLGSLQVDIGSTLDVLNWRPVISPAAAIDRCVKAFLVQH